MSPPSFFCRGKWLVSVLCFAFHCISLWSDLCFAAPELSRAAVQSSFHPCLSNWKTFLECWTWELKHFLTLLFFFCWFKMSHLLKPYHLTITMNKESYFLLGSSFREFKMKSMASQRMALLSLKMQRCSWYGVFGFCLINGYCKLLQKVHGRVQVK